MMTLDQDGLLEQRGLLTLKEAAAAVHVSVKTVRHWVARDQVYAVEWEGQTYVGERSLYDCELARRTGQGARRRSLASSDHDQQGREGR